MVVRNTRGGARRAAAANDGCVASCLHRIIRAAIIVGIEELLEPLDELKVVLKASLDQSVNRDVLEQKNGRIQTLQPELHELIVPATKTNPLSQPQIMFQVY